MVSEEKMFEVCLEKYSARKWIFQCFKSVFSVNLVGIW